MKGIGLLLIVCAYVFLFQAIALEQAFSAETLQITTFYPSPNGNYLELRSRRMAIGDNYSLTTSVCWAGGGCGAASVPADGDLFVEGRMGVNTLLAAAGQATDRLSVNGRISIPNGQYIILNYNAGTPTDNAIEYGAGGFAGVTVHGTRFRVQTGAPALTTRFLISNTGEIYLTKTEETTVDPFNGALGYAAVPRYKDKDDTP